MHFTPILDAYVCNQDLIHLPLLHVQFEVLGKTLMFVIVRKVAITLLYIATLGFFAVAVCKSTYKQAFSVHFFEFQLVPKSQKPEFFNFEPEFFNFEPEFFSIGPEFLYR